MPPGGLALCEKTVAITLFGLADEVIE